MKKLLLTCGLLCAVGLFNESKAQTGATSAKNETKDGKQCSSVGYGKDKQTAEKNRETAADKAKTEGHSSFSGKDGGGAAGCKDVKDKPKP